MTHDPSGHNPGRAPSSTHLATDEEVQSVFRKGLQGSIGLEAVSAFVHGAAVAPERCVAALRHAMDGGLGISNRTLSMLERTLPIFESALSATSSETERAVIRNQILELLREARAESRENRRFLKQLAGIASGAAALAIGAIVLLAKNARSRNAVSVASGRRSN